MKVLERLAPAARRKLDTPEALIKEARRRKRRRRLAVGLGVVLAVGGTIGGLVASNSGRQQVEPPVSAEGGKAPKPVVNAAAFGHHGELAFVSRGALWVLDGSTSSLRSVATPGLVASDPEYSHDGRWLAFIASKERPLCCGLSKSGHMQVLSSELWLARGNGTDAHPVRDLQFAGAVGWEPGHDVFAVTVGKATTVPFTVPTGIDLLYPATGAIRALVGGAHVWSAVWSPNGSSLAVSTEVPSSGPAPMAGVLSSYPAIGGPPTVWLRTDSLAADIVVPDGWWPVWGIGYTTVGSGAVPGGSATLDGSPFSTIAHPGAVPRLLGMTLQNEATGTPTASATGWLAFVAVGNGGRLVWQGKQVVVCSPAARCKPVPEPVGTVTLDPVWASKGTTLTYVRAPATTTAGYTQSNLARWYDAHQLDTYDPLTGTVTRAVSGSGATVPQRSRTGNVLLYVRNDGVWLRSSDARPVEVARPLFPPDVWPSYYGQVAFSSQFSWWSP